MAQRFVPPTQDEWCAYAVHECSMPPNEALRSWLYYDSKGWLVGKTKMVRWKSAVAGWALRCHDEHNERNGASNYARDLAAQKELERTQKALDAIRNSYEAHQSWAQDDRERWNKLIARKKELMGRLGL